MSTKNVVKRAEAEFADPLYDKIRESILALENLRAENLRLTDQVRLPEQSNLVFESEVQSLKLAVENERAERRHYHSLANEIVTRLGVVGHTIEGVVKRAEQEVYRQRRENPRAELPEIKVPNFLQKVEAVLNGHGEKLRAVQ
jgi:hypothetical protein